MEKTQCYTECKLKMTQMVKQEIFTATCSNHVMTCWTISTGIWSHQQWSHHPEKEARIHQNMTNVSVISASAKPDKPTPHGRYNRGKASNHERINDQYKTGNKMINDDNQRDLNMQVYETSRCYNKSKTNMMLIYQFGDSVSNQTLTPPLPVVYPPQQLITVPSFSGF